VVRLQLDANADVFDATILSGPDELRKAVLQSVLGWHFDRSAASTTRTVNIDFVKPATAVAPSAQPVSGGPVTFRTAPGASGRMAPPPPPVPAKLDHIEVTGLSDAARVQLLASLPLQEGAEWTGETLAAVRDAASRFDSHLAVGVVRSTNGELTLHIGVPDAGVYSVGNGTAPPAVLTKVDPIFPADEPAGFAGSVMLSIVVGTEGKAEDIRIVKSLGADFDASATTALQQWVFRPGTNQGLPVRVRAQIEVNFRKL